MNPFVIKELGRCAIEDAHSEIMDKIVDLIDSGRTHWFLEPRYALVFLPLVIGVLVGTAGFIFLFLFCCFLSAFFTFKLLKLKLLRHEKKRLEQAREALRDERIIDAIQLLEKPLRFSSFHYEVKCNALLSRAYALYGDFVKAHDVLANIKERRLSTEENTILCTAWAELFLRAENTNEAENKLSATNDDECKKNLSCLLLKAEIETLKSNFKEAREILESGFGVSKIKTDEMYLRNNLARVEGLQGRKDNQLQELTAAHEIFQKKPAANLTNIIHHNLAIALVKNGETEKAREVLREAFAVGNKTSLEYVLSVLNNSVERQLSCPV